MCATHSNNILTKTPIEIINIINYELKKKYTKINVTEDFFVNYDKIFEESDIFLKEIYFSVDEHYAFIKENANIELFQDFKKKINDAFANTILKNKEYKIFRDNDPFLISIWFFYKSDLDLISTFYSTLILKSFINTKKNKTNKFEKSDIILDYAINYFNNFLLFFDQENFSKSITNRDIRSHFFALYEYLSNINAIETKNTWIWKNNSIVSEKFWNVSQLQNTFAFNFNIFLNKPHIKLYDHNFYLIGGYHSKVYKIFHKNINSNLHFELNDISYLNTLIEKKWYIDIKWFDEIIKILNDRENITELSSYTNLKIAWEKLENSNWSDKIEQKKFSSCLYYTNVFNFHAYITKHNITWPIYFPFYFDFRGRMYYFSELGITNCKILRTIYHYGEYSENELYENIEPDFDILLNKYEKNIKNIKNIFEINANSKKINLSIVLLLISLGKICLEKKNYKIHMDLFIHNAENLINNSNQIDNVTDLIEAKSYINILQNFKSMKKRIIIKDFTASFFQHLTRLLGPSSLTTIELANMHNDLTWNDPYLFIINKFIENNPNIKHKNLFTRKFLKKTIMTIPYSIGINSAWNYFCENLNEIEQKNKEIKKEYTKFFNYVRNILENNDFFKNSSHKIILYAITRAWNFKEFKIKLDKSKVHLIYYESKTKIIDLIIKIDKESIRITKKINEINTDKIDYDNLAISVRANWIAMMDGEALRKISKLMQRGLFSVHDSILIDWLNSDKLIICCNKTLKENKIDEISWDNSHNYEIFSFFIIM